MKIREMKGSDQMKRYLPRFLLAVVAVEGALSLLSWLMGMNFYQGLTLAVGVPCLGGTIFIVATRKTVTPCDFLVGRDTRETEEYPGDEYEQDVDPAEVAGWEADQRAAEEQDELDPVPRVERRGKSPGQGRNDDDGWHEGHGDGVLI